MSEHTLTSEAEAVVAAVVRKLPAPVQSLARKVPVIYYDWPSEEILGDEFDPDILGLFVGESHAMDPGFANGAPTHILLFLENIWDEAEGDLARFREEVRITYLHEFGHYMGWNEEDLDDRGLA